MITSLPSPRRALGAAVAAVLLGACADAPLAPERPAALTGSIAASLGPSLDACPNLRTPATSQLTLHAYAQGVQIYRWDGAAWGFVAPSATLYADAGMHAVVATHFAGPTWRSTSGSTVVGAVAQRCTPDAGAIPWLLLAATSSSGPGVFEGTTFIQRLSTAGGLAPSAPGTSVGEVAEVPYTAEYVFYSDR